MSELPRSPAETDSALPSGTRLGEFELRGLLGVGGFGIVYRAFDHQLEREVAIKEYMPASMAGRTETMHVSLRSRSDAEVFALGLRSFVNEAKLLARFDHPSLLKVYRFWEANGTAYMAMPVLRGRTLKELRQGAQPAPIDEAWLRRMLEPLLGALETLHAEGVYHRDIAPDNIEIEPDGHPVLLDFGAARRVISDKTQTLTAILKPAYAPVEQYAEAGSVRQGPWTDLYALGATVHYLLLGRAPAPATARVVADDQAPLSSHRIDGCSEAFLHIVDWMLAPRPGERPQSVAALRAALRGELLPPPRAAASGLAQWERTAVLSPAAVHAAAEPPKAGPDEPVTVLVPRPVPGGARRSPAAAAGGAGSSETVPAATAPPQASAISPLPTPAASPPAAPAASEMAAPTAPVVSPRLARAAAAPAAAAPGAAAAPRCSVPPPPPASAPGRRSKAPVLALAAAVVLFAAVAAFALWPRHAADGTSTPAASAAAALPAAPASIAAGTSGASGLSGAPGPSAVAPLAKVEPAAAASTPAAPSPAAAAMPAAVPPGKHQTLAVVPPAGPASRPAAGPAPGRNPALKTPAAKAPEPARPEAVAPSAAPAAPPQPSAALPGTEPAASARPAAPPAAAAPAAEPARPLGPAATCSSKSGLAYFVCMERECLRSEFASHADCQKWHEGATRQRN